MKEALQAYIEQILESTEYREYALQRDLLKKDPLLRAQIDEFRTKNFEMQMRNDMVFQNIAAFEREYEEFMEHPQVSEFLEAELAFCRMMQRNNAVIMDAIDFD